MLTDTIKEVDEAAKQYEGAVQQLQDQKKSEQVAKSKGIALPFAIDPQGKLAALVKADYALGQRIGIEHTPTIWVVTASSKGAPFVEVVDRTKLYEMIDQAIADARGR